MSLQTRALFCGLFTAASLLIAILESRIGADVGSRLHSLIVGFEGLLLFLLHGGPRITVTGLFGVSYALFFGYGGWYVASSDGPSPGLTTALLATSLGLAGSALLMRPIVFPEALKSTLNGSGLVALGSVFIVVLIILGERVPSLVSEGAAFTSTVVVALGLIYGRSERIALASPVLIVPYVIVYSELFHGSSGRLRLVALAGCLAIVYSSRFVKRWHKWTFLALIPPALGYLAWDRLQLQEDIGGKGASVGNTGLESMITPPRAFGMLVDAQNSGRIDKHWGESFLSPVSVLFPSDWQSRWTPAVFNYELPAITAPSRYGTGYSTAGSYFGEWWWNFGALGIILAVVVTGPLLKLLDELVGRSLRDVSRSVQAVVIASGLLAFGGAVADLSWAGFHTWLVRGFTRLPILVIIGCFTLAKKGRF